MLNKLKSNHELNGHVGQLGNYDATATRWEVHFRGEPFKEMPSVRCKPDNLIWIMDSNTFSIGSGAFRLNTSHYFPAIMNYLPTYADLPTIDMAQLAQEIALSAGYRFEDRTHLLEQLQIDNIHDGSAVLDVFIKAATDAMGDPERKLMILFRRTMLSNAAMMFYKLVGGGDNPNRYAWDFKLFIGDDFVKSERGHNLTEFTYTNAVKNIMTYDMECTICMDKIDGHLDNVFITCGHGFHIKCFRDWMASGQDVTCPNCRAPYNPPTMLA